MSLMQEYSTKYTFISHARPERKRKSAGINERLMNSCRGNMSAPRQCENAGSRVHFNVEASQTLNQFLEIVEKDGTATHSVASAKVVY